MTLTMNLTIKGEKPMKRQTVTLPRREFYDKIKDLKPEIKTPVINAILDLFFEEKPINYSEYSETVSVALACLVPDLRRVQAVYDNGKCEKKSTTKSEGLFCPFEPSEKKLTEATASKTDSSILNNNIYNNIYNNKIISNQSSEKNKTTPSNKSELCSDQEKREFYAEAVLLQLKRIQMQDPAICDKMSQLVKKLSNKSEAITIKNELVLPEQILEQYLEFFRTPDDSAILERISEVMSRVSAIKTSNKAKYLVISLYNEAKNM